MKQTQLLMGTHITVDIRDKAAAEFFRKAFDYFRYVINVFSVYKPDSEISKINRGEITAENYSDDMKEILKLAEETRRETDGYFDIKKPDDGLDPSGVVKGWAIFKAARLLESLGSEHFFIDAGGDAQARVPAAGAKPWRVGIRNPFKKEEIVKVLNITNEGVATSGTYERGQHIYNPYIPDRPITEIVSLTVVGPNVYEADRFATAAFAHGKSGIEFIEKQPNLEGYMIDEKGVATMTSGFEKYSTDHR